MTWTTLSTIKISKQWQYSEPVIGEYFKLTHSDFVQDSLYLVSQVNFNPDGSVEYFDTSITQVSEPNRVIRLVTPKVFSSRRIALRQYIAEVSLEEQLREVVETTFLKPVSKLKFPAQSSKWSVKLEVADIEEVVESAQTPEITNKTPSLWLQSDKNTFQSTNGAASANNDLVGHWADIITPANYASQSVAENKCTLVTNQLNGKAVIRFGTSKSLVLNNSLANGNKTFFIVAKFVTSDIEEYLLGSSSSLLGYDDDSEGIRLRAENTSGGYFGGLKRSEVANSWKIFEFIINNPGDAICKINGVMQPGIVNLTGGFVPNIIGAFASGRNFSGDMAEIRVYDFALTEDEAADARTKIKAYWAIT